MRDLPQIIDYDKDQLSYALANALKERDEAREELRTAVQERHDFHWELLDAIRERDDARELALKFRDALVSIEEYWNRDQNETAMFDACWHAVNTAHDALAKTKEVLP